MTMKPPSAPDDVALARTAKALAHPARIALVRALAKTPSCCGHLVRHLSSADLRLAQSTVSQHLRILVDAGLVTRTRCGVESVFNLDRDAFSGVVGAMASLQPDTWSDQPQPKPQASARTSVKKA